MKALGRRVVIQRKETQIKRAVIVTGEPEFNYEHEIRLVSLGPDCPEDGLKPGDKIILNQYARPEGLLLLTPEKDDKLRVYHGIVNYDEIAGLDDEENSVIEFD